MKISRLLGVTTILALAVGGIELTSADAAPATKLSANTFHAQFDPQTVGEVVDELGVAALRSENPALSTTELTALTNDPTARVSPSGKLFFADARITPPDVSVGAVVPTESSIALSNTFLLHSNPGSNRTIYLDFDGHTVPANTVWDDSSLGDTAQLALGSRFACALSTTGYVRCWGNNDNGQIGSGYSLPNAFADPALVEGISNATAIGAAYNSACAVLADATVSCWGDNSFGQLGDGTLTDRNAPVAVSGVSNAVSVSVGSYHACAVITDGTVKCWGGGASGQLGNGTWTVRQTTAVTVSTLSNAESVDAGGNTTCAVLTTGSVNCWGAAVAYQLGNGSTIDNNTPVSVAGISTASSVSVALGSNSGDGSAFVASSTLVHACATLDSGAVQCWGHAGNYATGSGSQTTISGITTVSGISNAVSVSADGNSTCATLADGTAKCWGMNSSRQLFPSGDDIVTPTLVRATSTPTTLTGVGAIQTSGTFSCALSTSHSVLCWGSDYKEQLGDGSGATDQAYPIASGSPIVEGAYPPFTTDGSSTFSDAEKRIIIAAWQAIAEDYSIFNVDVTTEQPNDDALTRDDVSDQTYGTRALITNGNSSWNSDSCSCGGIAFLDVFNQYPSGPYTHQRLQPAFAFVGSEALGYPSPGKLISDVVSHEVGHNLSLSHDGDTDYPPGSPYREYFLGDADGRNWAPIMGGGYYNGLVQWSNGDYAQATNTENDVLCIQVDGCGSGSGGLTPVTDEAGNSATTARTISTTAVTGVIGTRSDVDWFKVVVSNGMLGVYSSSPTTNSNLDMQLTLTDWTGKTIFVTNELSKMTEDSNGNGAWPVTGLDGVLNATLPNGTYYVKLDGVGRTGMYSDYGSVGQYSIITRNPTVGAIGTAPTPTISGTKRRGRTLTLNRGTWTSGTSLSQQWLRDGSPIAGATGRTYVLTSADVGKKIAVRVLGQKSGKRPVLRQSAKTSTITN